MWFEHDLKFSWLHDHEPETISYAMFSELVQPVVV